MNKSRPTLQIVAEKAGVTKMTVSRYINNPKTVAKATGARIQAVIEELAFIPSRIPSMMAHSKSHAIGLLIPSFSNLVFSDFIKGVEDEAKKFNYNVLIVHTGYDIHEEERQISTLLSYQVDGIILTEQEHTELSIKRLKAAKIPVVEAMGKYDNPINLCIGLDHELISYLAIKGLIEAGRKEIAYFAVRMDKRTNDRLRGYNRAINEANLPSHIYSMSEHSNFTLGSILMRKALKDVPNLDALYCTNDDVAVGAMIELVNCGISVPNQISILGFNGLNIGQATTPKLCSIKTPRYEMGMLSSKMIIDKINSGVCMPTSNFGVELTEGSSLKTNEIEIIKQRLLQMQ